MTPQGLLSPTEAPPAPLLVGGRPRPSVSWGRSSMTGERNRSPSVVGGKFVRTGKLSVSIHSSPTVMEVDKGEKLKEALEEQVMNSKAIIGMARTELALLKCLQKSTDNESIAESVIKIITGEELEGSEQPAPTQHLSTGKNHIISRRYRQPQIDFTLTLFSLQNATRNTFKCVSISLSHTSISISRVALSTMLKRTGCPD
ncbi:hypothetical protein BC829DRAFT_278855 [Chytridium lagenaria]|nr:hypothetical protein BC829DRAFT_278855 [Chytridium lagenaria]